MGWYEVLIRIYVSISGKDGITPAQLVGRKSVVAIAITQADETGRTGDGDGKCELELPKRKDVKKLIDF